MLKAFKNNTILQIVVTLIATIILWSGSFISPVGMLPERFFSPLYGLFHSLLAHLPRLATAIALLLIFVEAIWFNIILSNTKLAKINWLMPSLLFILAMSWQQDNITLTPMLLAWLPLLAAINQLLSSGNTSLEFHRNFNATFFIGIAILCYLPVAVYIIPFFLVFVSYKSYHWRDFIIALMGFTAPLFVLVLYAFLTDKLDYYVILFLHDIVNVNLHFNLSNVVDIITNVFFIIILFWAMFSQLFSNIDNTIQVRINSTVIIFPLVAALFMLMYDSIFVVNTQLLAIPFTYFVSNLLATTRKRLWINELTFAIILLAPVIAILN